MGGTNIKKDDELSVCVDYMDQTYLKISVASYTKLYEFIKTPWYSGWHGFTPLDLTSMQRYNKMAEHCDHIHSIFDGSIKGIPVLSVVGLLNDNYEGG